MILHISVWICPWKLQKYAQWYNKTPHQRLSSGSFLLGTKHELSSPAVLPSRLIVFDTMSNKAISILTFTGAPFGNEEKVIDQVAINLSDRGSRDHHYSMTTVSKWLSTWDRLHAVQLGMSFFPWCLKAERNKLHIFLTLSREQLKILNPTSPSSVLSWSSSLW